MAQSSGETTTAKTFPQYVAGLSAASGAFAAGTLLGWTSPAQKSILNGEFGFDVDLDQFSWVGSAVTLSSACVCIPMGFLVNWIGRKLTLLLMVLPLIFGWCLLLWAQNVSMMIAARFIQGLSGSAFFIIVPMYAGEIAQKEIRGGLGSSFTLLLVAGILFVYVISAGLNVFYMTLVCGIFPLVFGFIFAFMPESPTYLVSKNKNERAIKSIQWLRGKNYDYKHEMEELQNTDRELREHPVSIVAALGRRETKKALAISLALMFFQTTSGVNAVIFYSADIFLASDLER